MLALPPSLLRQMWDCGAQPMNAQAFKRENETHYSPTYHWCWVHGAEAKAHALRAIFSLDGKRLE